MSCSLAAWPMMGNSSEEEGAGLPGAGQGEDPVFLRTRLTEVEALYAQVQVQFLSLIHI